MLLYLNRAFPLSLVWLKSTYQTHGHIHCFGSGVLLKFGFVPFGHDGGYASSPLDLRQSVADVNKKIIHRSGAESLFMGLLLSGFSLGFKLGHSCEVTGLLRLFVLRRQLTELSLMRGRTCERYSDGARVVNPNSFFLGNPRPGPSLVGSVRL